MKIIFKKFLKLIEIINHQLKSKFVNINLLCNDKQFLNIRQKNELLKLSFVIHAKFKKYNLNMAVHLHVHLHSTL